MAVIYSGFEDMFEIRHSLGIGGSAEVLLAQMKPNQTLVAVKMPRDRPPDEDTITGFKREAIICAHLKHESIVTFIGAFSVENFVVLVSEYMAGGDLFNHLAQTEELTECLARDFMRVLFLALHYMHHDCQVMHRDIKPDNLLLTTEKRLKLADFGHSTVIPEGDEMETSYAGTIPYMAPEMINRRPYTQAVDMWSSGVTTYMLLAGSHPFMDDELLHKERLIQGQVIYNSTEWEHVSVEARDFVKRLLQSDMKKRMTVEQALEHPWLNDPGISARQSVNEAHKLRFRQLNGMRGVWKRMYWQTKAREGFIETFEKIVKKKRSTKSEK